MSTLVSPKGTIAGSSGGRAANLSVAKQTLNATAGANARLLGYTGGLSTAGTTTLVANADLTSPRSGLNAAGTTTSVANADLISPRAVVSGSATVTRLGSAAMGPTLGTLVGYAGALISVSAQIGSISASGTRTTTGNFIYTAPLFDLAASGTRANSGSALLVAPVGRLATTGAAWIAAPGFQLTAIGTATVAVSYEAYALNLSHAARGADQATNDELTRFTNYPFDKIIRYQNSYFGVNSTGLYLLEGTTDDTTPIPYNVKTKLTDFGSDQLKTPEAAIFGGRLGPDATVTVYTGETEDDVYAYTTPRGQDVQNYRQKFGKGLKARYYAFGIQGEGAMTLDTVSFDTATLKRRI